MAALFPVRDNCSTLQDTVHFLLSSLVRFKGTVRICLPWGNDYILYSASFAWKLEESHFKSSVIIVSFILGQDSFSKGHT